MIPTQLCGDFLEMFFKKQVGTKKMPVIKEGNRNSTIVLYLGLTWGLEHVILSCPETPAGQNLHIRIFVYPLKAAAGRTILSAFWKKSFWSKLFSKNKSIMIFNHPRPKV